MSLQYDLLTWKAEIYSDASGAGVLGFIGLGVGMQASVVEGHGAGYCILGVFSITIGSEVVG